MKIKKNDNVLVIAGKDRTKTGKVLRVFPKKDLVLVEGMNMRKKHQRARRNGEKGQVVEKSMPMHISNVMIVDDGKKPTRVGKKLIGERFVRISKKTGKEI